jgi:L-erythro-3,5-diaminohexanoate dehydrogenase
MKTGGSPYGTHRVISPKGVLPQPADVIDNDMEIWDNELKINVKTLNIDSASFTEIVRRTCDGKKPAEITEQKDLDAIAECMKGIVAKAGKHKNPWTGSGGMLIGTLALLVIVPALFIVFQYIEEKVMPKRTRE